jgi:antitoxin (DNA-binding transcriptional repressor) of toxin-antitoxin stability system
VYTEIHNFEMNNTMLEKIGIREFRNNLAKYLTANKPVAVMRHGQTVGYFLPIHKKPEQAELESLKLAAAKLDELLESSGVTEDELIEEFRQLRQKHN